MFIFFWQGPRVAEEHRHVLFHFSQIPGNEALQTFTSLEMLVSDPPKPWHGYSQVLVVSIWMGLFIAYHGAKKDSI